MSGLARPGVPDHSVTSMRMRWNPIQARVSRSLSHS
jgi:hypothetical protein